MTESLNPQTERYRTMISSIGKIVIPDIFQNGRLGRGDKQSWSGNGGRRKWTVDRILQRHY